MIDEKRPRDPFENSSGLDLRSLSGVGNEQTVDQKQRNLISYATQLSYNINSLFINILNECDIDCSSILQKKLRINMKTWLRELFLLFESLHKLERNADIKVSHAMAFKPILLHLLNTLA